MFYKPYISKSITHFVLMLHIFGKLFIFKKLTYIPILIYLLQKHTQKNIKIKPTKLLHQSIVCAGKIYDINTDTNKALVVKYIVMIHHGSRGLIFDAGTGEAGGFNW